MVDQIEHRLLSELKNPEDLSGLVSKVIKHWSTRTNIWHPPTDVYETEKTVVIRIEIAGMSDAEFTLSFEENVVAIRGVRPAQDGQRAYHRMEISSGEFLSVVELPQLVDYDRVEAAYQDGFLQVILPKI